MRQLACIDFVTGQHYNEETLKHLSFKQILVLGIQRLYMWVNRALLSVRKFLVGICYLNLFR